LNITKRIFYSNCLCIQVSFYLHLTHSMKAWISKIFARQVTIELACSSNTLRAACRQPAVDASHPFSRSPLSVITITFQVVPAQALTVLPGSLFTDSDPLRFFTNRVTAHPVFPPEIGKVLKWNRPEARLAQHSLFQTQPDFSSNPPTKLRFG